MLREGYLIFFLAQPPLSKGPISFFSYAPSSSRGSPGEGAAGSFQQGCSRDASPTPGSCCRIRVREAAGLRTKTLSLVNQVLDGDCSVRLVFSRQDYCMILLDLKDLFFQAPFIRTVEKVS